MTCVALCALIEMRLVCHSLGGRVAFDSMIGGGGGSAFMTSC